MIISSYCSIGYCAVFLPIVIIIYSITPKKYRWIPLLVASYVLFCLISGQLILYLLFTTLCIYLTGLWISSQNEKCKEAIQKNSDDRKSIKKAYQKKQRAVITVVIVAHILVLAVLKYSKFFTGNVNDLFSLLHIPVEITIPKIAAPIGISFYTLQAISYVADVYNKKMPADKHLGRVALYMSFFPQIMEGPICRYSDTAHQLFEGKRITQRSLNFGIQRLLFGLLKKIVVADRLNALVENTFDNFNTYNGSIAAIAAVCYTIQLYMEFSGTMDIVIGSAEIFGIKLPENFSQPFFSKTISEFWQRWHITLGAWFKNYIFYPVSMSSSSKKLTKNARKKIGNFYGPMLVSTLALFCVWFCNGMWHGAGWRYIFFGMYHFVLITIGNLIKPAVKNTNKKLNLKPSHPAYKAVQIVRTTIFVCIGEMFFRADGLRAGFVMFKKLFCEFSFKTFTDGSLLDLGIDLQDYLIVFITVILVFVIGLIKEKGKQPRELIAEQKLPIRWTIYFALIFYIIIFGAYGYGYVPVDPIYAEF